MSTKTMCRACVMAGSVMACGLLLALPSAVEAGVQAAWIQVAAHGPGLHGSQWRTDLGLRNVSDYAASVQVRFHPAAGGDPYAQTTQVAGGAQSVLEDVVGQLGASGSGALEVIADQPVVVTSRTYTLIAGDADCTPGGTFGQYYAGYLLEDGLAAGEHAWLPHLAESDRFRTNLAFTNMGSDNATVQVELFDGAGTLLDVFNLDLAPGQVRQRVQVFKDRAGQTAMERGSARVTVTKGFGVIVSASVVDNITNDPTTIPMQRPPETEPLPDEVTVMLPGGVPLTLVRIPAGTFMMGSPEDERGREVNEGPRHPVTLTRDYYLGRYPVTQGQWLAVMGENPSHYQNCGLDCPVERVSWDDVCGGETGSECSGASFIGTLNAYLAATAQPGAGKLRMPTEAEWEYAARAGTATRFSHGDVLECGDEDEPCEVHDQYMWWGGNNPPSGQPGHGPKPVGLKLPNSFGLFDMHGNVSEWVADWLGWYASAPVTDPKGPSEGSRRVARGGGWSHVSKFCRSARRYHRIPDVRVSYVGFRLAMSAPSGNTRQWIQVAAHNPGLHGSQWRTDLGLLNTGQADASVEVWFHPGGDPPVSQVVHVPAGAQAVVEDVVGAMGESGAGALELVPDRPVIATTRTYNQIAADAPCTPGGTFGQYYAAHHVQETLAEGESVWLAHLAESSRFRTNVAFTNAGDLTATLLVELFDGAGILLDGFSFNLPPGRVRQRVQVFKERAGQTNMLRGSARVTVTAGSGVIASASVVDNVTNDPTTIPALPEPEALKPSREITIMLPGDVPLTLLLIPAGTYMRGSEVGERGWFGNETPRHKVTLTRSYYLGKYPVTQGQWEALMWSNPSKFPDCGPDCPIDSVSWNQVCSGDTLDACAPDSFIWVLNHYLSITGQPGAGKFRLPTEAEWEHAARAGTTSPFSFPAPSDWPKQCVPFPEGEAHMWWCANAGGSPHPVGLKQPSPWGLYDMHGNMQEWVWDWWGDYTPEPLTDPIGPPDGAERVCRGGSMLSPAEFCRSAARQKCSPGSRYNAVGFRLARSL